jgi:hypothetical protein
MTTDNTLIGPPDEPEYWKQLNAQVFGDDPVAVALTAFDTMPAGDGPRIVMIDELGEAAKAPVDAETAATAKALAASIAKQTAAQSQPVAPTTVPDDDVDEDEDIDESAAAETDRTPVAPALVAESVPNVAAAIVPAADEDTAMVPLKTGMKWVVGGVVFAVLVLAVLGFVVSFDTQTREVEPYFGEYAPLVPLAIDLGIVVFAALNLVLARLNMSIMWLRAVPWVLTAMTLYINLSAHHELVARVAHVALPGMWIVASEVGTHVLRIRAGLEAGTRTESLGLVRWFLDPVSTFRLWRYMRLWGLHTAKAARDSEAQRLEAKAALRFRYKTFWRFRAPVQLRTAYRLRRLDADTVYAWRPPVIVGDEPETAIEDTREDTGTVPGDAVAIVPEDTTASVLKDANEDAMKDAPGDAFKDSAEDAVKDASKDAAKDAPGDTAKDATPRPRRPRKDTGKRRGAVAKTDAEYVAELRKITAAEGRKPSIRDTASRLGVSKDRATRLLNALDATQPAT